MKLLEGNVVGTGLKVGIVAARFNEFIVSKLVSGAQDALVRHGVSADDIEIAWVPGAFEIPLIAQKMANSGKYDMVLCLGAVIRGSTSHYDLVCNECAKGIAQVSLSAGIPVLFGVVTTDTIEQAIERAGTKAGNKGFECGVGAIEMVNVLRQLVKVIVDVQDEKEIREYKVEQLKFKPRRKKEKLNLNEKELKELKALEKDEGKSKLDDN